MGWRQARALRQVVVDDALDQRVGFGELRCVGAGREQRLAVLRRAVAQHLPVLVADRDFDAHSQPEPYRMLGELLWIELDPPRPPLPALHPVAAGVLPRPPPRSE